MAKLSLAIFDLDGVIVDTAKYHYEAWNRLTEEYFQFHLSQRDYEKFKGVSRLACMEIVGELAGITLTEEEKIRYAEIKNNWYISYINQLTNRNLLPGAEKTLRGFKEKGIKTALGSASKNSGKILQILQIRDLFDVVVDGTIVSRAKPDPEVFLKSSEILQIPVKECMVFEDAYAGIEAARAGGMFGFGIGTWENLPNADFVAPDLAHVPLGFFCD